MSSERQNKAPDWKQSLLQWEQAGGHTEPKEDLLWERLQEKLEPKKKGVLFLPAALLGQYRRITAVAVLILLAVSLFFLLRKNDISDKAEVVKISSPATPKKEEAAIVVKESVSPPSLKDKITPPFAGEKKDSKRESLQYQKVNNVKIDPIQPEIAPIPELLQANIENKISDTPVVVKAIPPKRKLRIVHMNELNAPPPPTYAALKEELRPQIEPEPEIISAPSIWPGKNKPKPSTISLGN